MTGDNRSCNGDLNVNSTEHSNHKNGRTASKPGYRSYGATDSRISTPGTADDENESTLPPTDRGWSAWLFLACCFWLEGLVRGLPYSYRAFENNQSNLEPLKSEVGIAATGTAGLGFVYLLAPVLVSVLERWPAQRKVSIIGFSTLTIGLATASFAIQVIHLVLTQGLLYGVGGALVYNPFIFYLDEWFVKRKGLAYGSFWAGTGVFSSVTPFVMHWALNKYVFRTPLRAWPVFVFFLTIGTLIYCVRPRIPLAAKSVAQGVELGLLKTRLFWAFQAGNIIEGFGYFGPQIYLPSFAEEMNLSPLALLLSVSVLNISSTISLIFISFLIDYYHISTVLLLSAITSTLCAFLIWGFATTEPMLYIFAILFGLFAGGYKATWTGCATEVKKENTNAAIAVIMALWQQEEALDVS